MDTNIDRTGDLNELERRLASWAPTANGLNADVMIFAAGRASARPGLARFLWPSLAACATALAVVLGISLAGERAARLELARQIEQLRPVVAMPSPPVAPSPEPATTSEPQPDSYMSSRIALEEGLDAWPPRAVASIQSADLQLPEPPILKVRNFQSLLVQ